MNPPMTSLRAPRIGAFERVAPPITIQEGILRRTSVTARVAVLVGVCAVGAPVAIATASAIGDTQATRLLPGSVADLTGGNAGVGAVSGTGSQTIEVWMAGHEQAAQRFVDAVSTPGSPNYRRYLSPAAYTAKFGPSPAQVSAVRAYLSGHGFAHVHASVNDDYVSATASVATINRAFSTQLRRYLIPGAHGSSVTIAANDRALSVPVSVSGDILAVTGLDSAPPQPAEAAGAASASAPCSKYWGQKTTSVSPAFKGLTMAALPVCGYSARQIRSAYGLSSADTGRGTTIALIQVGVPLNIFRSLTEYAARNGLTKPRAARFHQVAVGPSDHGRTCPDAAAIESAIDSETAYAIAPDATQLVVHAGNCEAESDYSQALADALLEPLTGSVSKPKATVESSSYDLDYGGERTVPASQRNVVHAIALRAAAEGVSLLFDAGDTPGVDAPASDPDVTAVGGTTLGIGAENQRLFETGWSGLLAERTDTSTSWKNYGVNLAGGGGASALYAEPSYQRGVVPNSLATNSAGHLARTVPDIAADGDPDSGMLFGLIAPRKHGKLGPYEQFRQAGTSMATPLVAGIVADAAQGRRFGFLNPLLYSLAGTDAFHDVESLSASAPQTYRAVSTTAHVKVGKKFINGLLVEVNDGQGVRGTHQVTAPGYDTMTGLGTPNGAAFIKALRSGKRSSRRSRTAARGNLPRTKPLTVQVWLRPDLNAAQRFATAVSTPGNPMFRDFLSPDAYTARFGPTTHEVSAVKSWLRSRGFGTVAADTQRDYVRATASVTQINATLHTSIQEYRGSAHATSDGSPLYSNDRSLTVPASLAPDILGVTGLNDAAPTVPLEQQGSPESSQTDAAPSQGHVAQNRKQASCSAYWGQHMLSGLPSMFNTTSFPEVTCGYTPNQFRSAYGANMTNIGTGQTIAFAEAGGLEANMFKSLQDFTKQYHLPAPAAARYKELNLQPASCKKHDESAGEEEMDVESAYAMAPGATQVVVGANLCGTGDGGFQGAFNADLAIINGNGRAPLASVVSNSWETGYDDQAKDIDRIETAFLVKAAAVGVGMYYASGDSACTTQPASNPYATGVGATTLAIGKSGSRLFETGGAIGNEHLTDGVWSEPVYSGYGGGQSLVYPQPSYQKGAVPTSMSTPSGKAPVPGQAGCRDGGPPPRPSSSPMRSTPDVSASAGNAEVGLINYKGKYVNIIDGGTSLSTPLVAGMVIAAQQGQAKPFGFLNPALYKLAGTSAFYDPLPITSKDPLLWRAQVCPQSYSGCGGTTTLWLTADQSPRQRHYSGQVTAKGYDNTTGIGVPRGQAFISALRKLG
jgi:subtilase family serine protease